MTDAGRTVKFPDLNAIEVEAAEWIARLDRNALTPSEREEFAAWQARSTRHREALARLSTVWSDLDLLQSMTLPPGAPEKSARALPPRRETRRMLAYAATIVLGAGIAFGLLWNSAPRVTTMREPQSTARLASVLRSAPTASPMSAVYRTKIGEQKTVALPDGSTVLLNTNSLVDVRFAASRRDVRLVRGEAYFDVVHDAARPFSVTAGDDIVRDVGTAFAVRLTAKTVEVTVTKGRVALAAITRHSDDPAAAPGTADERPLGTVSANQGAVIASTIERLAPVPDATINRKLSWRFGILVYAGEPLKQVVADVSRYTDVEIEIADPKLADLPVGGYFQVGQTDALFEALQRTFGIRVEHIGPARVRLSLPS